METRWLTIIRDLISIGVGSFGLVHSQLTGQTSIELLIVYTALLGYPGILQIVEGAKRKSNGSGSGKSE